jgi:hypothetical protein
MCLSVKENALTVTSIPFADLSFTRAILRLCAEILRLSRAGT